MVVDGKTTLRLYCQAIKQVRSFLAFLSLSLFYSSSEPWPGQQLKQ